ncbi:hypothetical protein [Hymenobacter ruricola]|uniref:Uncharacterized protein n=1 Tax=Hymenobacter ruricola TaxID=2791023 RepID=A0ABS0HYP5_9BACT|nr:hypothetical protein [Hymenobacter ruricola]MBF9219821.1 hypothetical protein [Hymenobacter ruricola]
MRTLCFLLLAVLLLDAPAANAYRLLGIGRPSARQRQKYSYMLNGRRVRRVHRQPVRPRGAALQSPS